MSKIVTKLRTGKEKVYGALMVAFGVVIWPLAGWGIWNGLQTQTRR